MQTLAYLVIPNYKVQSLNAEANQYVAGLPAITSFTGFSHQQIRLLAKTTQLELYENGTMIIVHDFHLRDGHPRCPSYMTHEKGNETASIVEEFKADMTVSLIIEIGIDDEEDEDDFLNDLLEVNDAFKSSKTQQGKDIYLASQALKAQIQHSFLAGGHCIEVGEIQLLEDENQLQKWLQQSKKGFVICDRLPLLTQAMAENQSPLEMLIDSVSVLKIKEDTYQAKTKGWMLPVAVGYQAIEQPQQREQARHHYPHLYTEPVTGLAEAVSVKKIAFDTQKLFKHPVFWRHRYQAENGLYYVTALGE